ncbi:MAG TPA: hypothetical protein VJ805_01375 [Nitrospiraceae bacterium]|nr:hypothetical protein [Nitrospiraceae bacterium]
MSGLRQFCRLAIAVALLSAVALLAPGIGFAQANWVDEIGNSLNFYKINYPTSNWEPYSAKLETVKEAVNGGDQRKVKVEMGKWFKMLRARDHGINDVAADELFNFALMVTPVQEYGIAVPAVGGGSGESGF